MGPVDWKAVVLAAVAASAVAVLFRRPGRPLVIAGTLLVMLVPAAMLGHALARIGPEKLAIKPWLYFMQSGGVALAFIIPALWISLSRNGQAKAFLREAATWLAAMLAMGLAFWLV